MADASDPDHGLLVATLEEWPGELVVSAFTAAEADHLVLTRLGVDAELALIDDLAVTYTVQALALQDSSAHAISAPAAASSSRDSPMPRWSCLPSSGRRA